MAIPAPPPETMPNETEPSSEAGPSTGLPKYKLAQTLSAHSRGVTALRFSPDGKVLVSAGADGWLHFWEPKTGEHIRSLRCHKTGINDISISPDSLYIATASDDCTSTIHLLHPPNSASSTPPPPLRILSSHTAPILSIAFSPKSNLLVTGSFDESAIIWDVRRGKALRVLPAHADAIWCVGWDAEGGMVLTASADGLIRLWDANNGQCLKTLDNDTNSPVSFATLTPSSSFLLSSTLSSTLRVYNIHTSKVLKTLRAPGIFISERYPCPAIVFPHYAEEPTHSIKREGDAMDVDADVDVEGIPNGHGHVPNGSTRRRTKPEAWVVTGSENGKLIIWDLQTKRVLQVLEGHQSPLVAIAVHPDGKTIASGSLEVEKVVKLWRDD
ncbi:hypothetical protein CI109_106573 [Kwoniella shandongensis]|uniref:Uncharacterized protein n=1 Tax=Kwoniella shandongensis TaxID=1734106 RepID=A0A5M6C1I9_9TREE|nr:uncharacterized protein CI109_002754 [Kwoniella shandongensis]KAA5528996.1 hypothetical protein CI109_002754 [Kwoniella shandongensis]